MNTTQRDIAALIGSRICHDLISPLGAIGNGVELLGMSGTTDGPEMALINESVISANARIRFFRIAFGAASQGQVVGRDEIVNILHDITLGGRLTVDWNTGANLPRAQVKLAFLLIQCFETAMPYGGTVTVEHSGDRWTLHCDGARLNIDSSIWELLVSTDIEKDISPAEVHFALVPDAARRAERVLQADLRDDEITLDF
ncbi:MAG: histidine phosphotransferase [Marinosulfonomonas sp.]|nr:histidine phosphotransferase [Marinosulfonomonas sp.]